MKSDPAPTPSALSVRRFRDRLRERGLIKKDVWILPEYAAALAAAEQRWREAGALVPAAANEPASEAWTLDTLAGALAATGGVVTGQIGIERIEGAEPALQLTMRELGDLPVLVAVAGEQILVETYLWPASAVKDAGAFNALALATHKYLPLATFSLSVVGGEPGYTLFGSLDVRASLACVLLEIQAIADQAIAATELYASQLTEEARP